MKTPRLRRAARALILDPDNSVLLVRFPTADGNYWATPGGGLEPGESMRDGLRRELDEELGQPDLDIGPLLWTRTSWFAVADDYDGQYNEIYLIRSPRFDPVPRIGWDAMAAEGVTDIRWWTLDEIETAPPTEKFVPTDIVELTRRLIAEGPPTGPRSLNANSFGIAADAYDRGRPGYPTAAVDWLTEPLPPAGSVVDIGAGTGKLSRALSERGFETVAVDPDATMLERLSRNCPDIPTVVGSAESVAVEDDRFDAAVFGQAWHWVDVEAASTEVGRIVRPGGYLGMIWNIRDDRTEWVAEMSDIIHASPAETVLDLDNLQVAAPFGPLESFRVEWSQPMSRRDIIDMVASRSYYITANPRERGRIDHGLADLLDRLGLLDDATIEHPYVTHVYRATHLG